MIAIVGAILAFMISRPVIGASLAMFAILAKLLILGPANTWHLALLASGVVLLIVSNTLKRAPQPPCPVGTDQAS